MPKTPQKNIAFFISPHGFGHAARACAVMLRLARIDPNLHFSLYTKVPLWFFQQSLLGEVSFSYFELLSDIGFIQSSATVEDHDATITALSNLYPLRESLVGGLGEELARHDTKAVLCDISVLGLAVAHRLGIPSVLIENFTWDWMYQGYVDIEPRFRAFIQYLSPLYEMASRRIQAEPIGSPRADAITVAPLARPIRSDPGKIRDLLKIPPSAPMILCTMGGTPGQFSFLEALGSHHDLYFALAGTEFSGQLPMNVRTIPHASSMYHPDLVAAADAVVGKAGYSTVAEAYCGRTQFFYLPRPRFPESAIMEQFVSRELCGVRIDPKQFESGEWASTLSRSLSKVAPQKPHGSPQEQDIESAIHDLIT